MAGHHQFAAQPASQVGDIQKNGVGGISLRLTPDQHDRHVAHEQIAYELLRRLAAEIDDGGEVIQETRAKQRDITGTTSACGVLAHDRGDQRIFRVRPLTGDWRIHCCVTDEQPFVLGGGFGLGAFDEGAAADAAGE